MAELFVNDATTSLGTTTTTSATSWTVSSSTGFPTPANGDYFIARIEPATPNGTYEIVRVTGIVGTTWTVIRNREFTVGVAWAAGARISAVITASSMSNKANLVGSLGLIAESPAKTVGISYCVGGVWEARASTRPDMANLYISPLFSDGVPPDFINGKDVLLQPPS